MPGKTPTRNQTLISNQRVKPSKRVAEIAGGTTADCAVVICCCPCVLFNLLVLTVIKLPAFLFCRALRKSRSRSVIKKEIEFKFSGFDISAREEKIERKTESTVTEALEFDNEMLHRFYGNGFWRSPSQRE